jgi:hypothetical protein
MAALHTDDVAELEQALRRTKARAAGDSNDEEFEALNEALDLAVALLAKLGYPMTESELPDEWEDASRASRRHWIKTGEFLPA